MPTRSSGSNGSTQRFSRSTVSAQASALASRVEMSWNRMPGLGKSGTCRICALRSIAAAFLPAMADLCGAMLAAVPSRDNFRNQPAFGHNRTDRGTIIHPQAMAAAELSISGDGDCLTVRARGRWTGEGAAALDGRLHGLDPKGYRRVRFDLG